MLAVHVRPEIPIQPRVPAALATAFALLLLLITVGRVAAGAQAAGDQLAVLKAEGQQIFMRDCASCHGAEGTGDGAGPALDGNTNLGDKDHVVKRILLGSPEKGMDAFGKVLTDREIAATATFVRNAWNNAYGMVAESEVAKLRESSPTAR
jgi:mono/diheme cytochrome c family protein